MINPDDMCQPSRHPVRSARIGLRGVGFLLAALGAAALALLAVQPVGILRGTMLLVVALPVIAHSLESLGWADILARRLAGSGPGQRRLLGAYVTWLGVSAVLTLDVAAVVATPVGLAIARRWRTSPLLQVGVAILGSNVGSMLFPFSNLTNLLVVAGTGIAFTTYVRTGVLPQVLAALAVGFVLVVRARRASMLAVAGALSDDMDRAQRTAEAHPPRMAALVAGATALLGAIVAVIVGVAGGDVAIVFLAVAATCAALAVANRAGTPSGMVRSIPITGIAVVLFAAVARGPMVDLAAGLPRPGGATPSVAELIVVAGVGGIVAAAINNLPAAAFGSLWLVGASPQAIIAFLLGVNILNMVTPHGSLATILARAIASAAGHHLPSGVYLRHAWRYAAAGTVAGLVALAVAR